jgi:alcohol dehydrogenase (cytochrome c)
MTRRRRFLATLATSALALAMVAATASAQQPLPPLPKPDTPPPVPPMLQNYKPVTADRLKQPEDSDWLMYRRTYDGWGATARSHRSALRMPPN